MDSQEIPSSSQRSDRCHATVYSISEYIDGGLTAGEVRAIAEHLAVCKPCESMRAEIDQLRVLARDLPEHSPRAVLWTRVQAEIESEIVSDRITAPRAQKAESWWERLFGVKVSLNLPQLAGATALVALLAGYSATTFRPNGNTTGRISPSAISAQLVDDPILTAEVKAKLDEYNSRKARLDPSIRIDFESVLKGIDSSIQGCKREVSANPTSTEQQAMFRSLYEEKIRLIDDMNRLTR